MASDRCPSCGAAVRQGDPWCTLCWTDLRPKPAPPPAPAPVPAAPAAPAYGTAPAAPAYGAQPGLLTAPVDPLTAPLAAVLGQPVAGVATDPAAQPADPDAPAASWPCVECGEANALDRDTCGVCTAPFGGRIARLDDVKAARRRYMLLGVGAVVVFLMLLATLTFAGTSATTVDDSPSDPYQTTIDYSQLPQEE